MRKTTSTETRVSRLRVFNRFFTETLGLLDDGFLGTPYSLRSSRLIFEIGTAGVSSPRLLTEHLNLNAGYVSRLLSRLKQQGLVRGEASRDDGRRQVLSLTDEGREVFKLLNERASQQVRELLTGLNEDEQRRLMISTKEIESLLGGDKTPVVVIRPPVAGDHGWVVQRHGELYAREYGWDETFEALVARVIADYVDHRDLNREAGWIAEIDGERVGCVFCMEKENDVAQLRLLFVEPSARGMGIGGRLVEECIRFARRAGYGRMMLWTNDVLVDARKIYERNGFQLVEEQKHHSFGHDLVGQNWWLDLL